jgi:predicted DNA-binding protein
MASTGKAQGRGKAVPEAQFSERAQPAPAAAKKAKPPATSRRMGKPKTMYALNVRIPRDMDERITAAVERTGMGPQAIAGEAINDYATAVGVPEDLPVPTKEDRPFRERTPKKRTYGSAEYNEERQFAVRITPLTDARLTAACDVTGNGPQDFVRTALNVWLHKRKIPYSARQD